MTEIAFVWTIVAGKEEEWRRLLQELEGSRSDDFGRMRSHLGIDTIRVWLQRIRYGELVLAYVKVDDPVRAILALAVSEEPFELWFKGEIERFHGVDVGCPRPNATPELVFSAGPTR